MIKSFLIKWCKFAGDHPRIYWGVCLVYLYIILTLTGVL